DAGGPGAGGGMSALEDPVTVAPDHRFGLAPDFSLGVEEELLVVDRDDLCLAPDSERLVRAVHARGGSVCSEIFAAELELVPPLHALAANSPFWHGRDSGLASARAAILRSYPRCEIPRAFHHWEHFCETAADLARTADVEDYTYFWWDVRPHPRLGTVEVRAP